jgi:hypothetical protein
MRIVTVSTVWVCGFGHIDDDNFDGVEVMGQEGVRELVAGLRERYPEHGKHLPEPEKMVLPEKPTARPKPRIELIAHFRMNWTERPEGEFENHADMIRATMRNNPPKVNVRIVYEVLNHNAKTVDDDPVLSIEVVTLRFGYRDERWEALAEADNAVDTR